MDKWIDLPFAKSAYLRGVEVETGEKPRMLLRTAHEFGLPMARTSRLQDGQMGRWADGRRVLSLSATRVACCENLPVTMRSATPTSGERQGRGMVGALPCHRVARSEAGSAADCCPIWGQ